MRLWRSVVGKLWMTILFLVSFVLIILTILLLEFFENYHVSQIEQTLSEQAKKMSNIIEAHANDNMGEEIVFEIIDEPVGVAIAYSHDQFMFSPRRNTEGWIPTNVFLEDEELSKVFTERTTVKKELTLPEEQRQSSRYENYIVAGVPLEIEGNDTGAVFAYQSLTLLKETTRQTTRLILLAAGIAIILTTFFAFFFQLGLQLHYEK